jgi:hypothetical protein
MNGKGALSAQQFKKPEAHRQLPFVHLTPANRVTNRFGENSGPFDRRDRAREAVGFRGYPLDLALTLAIGAVG